jgi:hypothetical protein
MPAIRPLPSCAYGLFEMRTRVEKLQRDVDDLIDQLAREERVRCEGVPIPVLRAVLIRNDSYTCRVLRRLAEEAAVAKAAEAQQAAVSPATPGARDSGRSSCARSM